MKQFRHLLFNCLPVISIIFSSSVVFSQGFTNTEYKKALWMTTRMYGGQRSGSNNWLLYNHLPSGVAENLRGTAFIGDKDTDGYDVSGGWHDCGDHVKFGQTEFYSAYMLLKGYAEFPKGYDDYYSYDYKGYATSGKWNWEDGKHDPNGIPDILDEVKHATDYFIKCAKNSTTFYYQVGEGGPDHQLWITATKMQTESKGNGGQPRTVYKNPADASMASFCGATLALMSRLYKKYDPAYATKCLTAAKNAYEYAKAHKGVAGTGDGGFYGPNENWKDDYSSMCAELYWATGTDTYKTEALSFSIGAPGQGKDIFWNSYGFDYTLNGEIAFYNHYLLGRAEAKTLYDNTIKTNYLAKVTTDGQFSGGNTGWGPLRYNANAAFLVALWQKMNGTNTTVHKFIYDNIDYILGKNSSSLSFIVGFGSKYPKFPHHRNVYLRDDNPSDGVKRTLAIPSKNVQFGLMVGGTRNPAQFSDDLVNFQHTEGGIDYNACLVGALAYINSILAPIDTNKFGNTTPDLGPNQSICGLSSIILDSKIAVDNIKTFTWLKDGQVIQTASTSKNKLTVTAAGKYTVKLDSLGKFSTESTVEILGVLPDVSLGNAKELCDPVSVTLDAVVTGTGIRYEWQKNTKVIDGANAKTYTVYSAGTYKVVVSATGCPSKSSEVLVTSKLPAVTHDTICKAGTVNLAVSGSGGPYEWYDSPTSTTVLKTGTTYSTTISASKTFYVKDAGSLAVTAGPSSAGHTLSGATNGGAIGIRFTALKPFQITQMKVLPFVYSCNGETISITVVLKKDGATVGTYVSTPVACTGVQSGAPFNTYYTLNFATPISVASTGSYELTPSAGNQLAWFGSGANFTTMDAAGVIDITDDTRDDNAVSFPGIFDLKIQAGSTCARTPVFAVIDSRPECSVVAAVDEAEMINKITVYPNPSSQSFNVSDAFAGQIRVFDEMGRILLEADAAKQRSFGENLPAGMYHIIFMNEGEVVKAMNAVKF
jgi:hypothetical protein